ncbi:MAG: glutamyl-tRNA reductase [Selenomonadaceae bacterium]|nr:glutamyl-tRNA reductase [Selenomonadaceae bacterium]
MHLKVLGLNHTTTPIEIREKFSIGKDAIRRGLENLDGYDGLSEAVILSTCNRSEIYSVTAAGCDTSVYQFLSDLIGGAVDKNFLYEYDDETCAEHLFEVAAGLDSLILGEGQILSQVKEAYSIAKTAQATSTILNTLFHRAIATGKRVRTETRIACNSVSVSSAAVELAAKKLGGLEGRSALIFGAGKMAQLTAQHLLSHGVNKIYVANHHLSRAEEMAAKIGGEAVAWEEAFTSAANVDIIITSTGAPHYVVKPWQTQQLMTRRAGRGIFFIDIAVPRDVDPEVGKIKGVTLYNIDDLESVVEKNLQARQREALIAKKIVAEDATAVMERFKYLRFQPLMACLSERAEQIRLREIRRVAGKLSEVTDEEQKVIDQMTRRIVRKLLRMPMMNLNASAGTDAENFYTQAVKALFTDEETKNFAQN